MRTVPSVKLPMVWLVLTAIAFLSAPFPAVGQGGEPQYFAIRGATVVPVSGARMENATVIISRGIITAVAKDAAIPEEAWVIEGKGLIVYPGLIDAYSDLGLQGAVPAAAGEGVPRAAAAISRGPEDRPGSTPWRDAAGEATLADKRIETWRNAGFTSTVSAPKGGIFPGQAALLNLGGERNGDMVVKSPVAIPVSLQPVGNFASFPGSLMGTIGYVRQVWLDTAWSTKSEETYEKSPKGTARPRYDRTETALADALEDHAVVLIPANNSVQILRAFDLAERWHVNGVLYGGQMGYAVAAEVAAKKLPVLVDLKWPEAEKDSDPDFVPSLRTLRFREMAASTPGAFAKAGVKFAFYSGGITAPKDILKAVKKSIDAGLAPDAALRALTLSAAEILGVADRMGSLENGKIANLVIADGDLFDEKTKIKTVFVDGRRYEVREQEKPKETPKKDISGKWTLKYTTPDGEEQSSLELTMASDGTLSGSTSSKRGDSKIVSGNLSGEKFTFTINISIEGSPSDVIFDGTFDGTALKGTISVPSVGFDTDFTGARTKPTTSEAGGAS